MSGEQQESQTPVLVFAAVIVALVVLRFTQVITWDWTWVLSPLWVPFGIGVLGASIQAVKQLVARHRKPKRMTIADLNAAFAARHN